MKYKEILQATFDEIAQIENSIFLGYNVLHGSIGGGMYKNIPKEKLFETPVAEGLMVSTAIGLSLVGYLPIVYFERYDFITNAIDAIVNHLDKISSISRGEFNPQVIIRVTQGNVNKPLYTGPTHTQCLSEGIKRMVEFPVIDLWDKNTIRKCYFDAISSKESCILVEKKDYYDN